MNDSPFLPESKSPSGNPPVGRVVLKLLSGVVLGLLLVGALWKFGLINAGRERQTVTFHGFSTSSRGIKLGSKKVYARAGQSVVVDYSVEAGGSLMLQVRRPFAVAALSDSTNALWTQHVNSVGKNVQRVPIGQSGFYEIAINAYPPREQTLVYDVRWRVE